MTKQMTKTALMAIWFVIGLSASSAIGQVLGNGGLAPAGYYTGVETTEGAFSTSDATYYGNTIVLASTGEWESYHLTVSLNYSTDTFVANNFIVTGGSWSLVVIRENQYAGTLYGDVQAGSVNLVTNASGDEKQTQANLKATGGTGIFEGKSSEEINGVLSTTTDLHSSSTTGTVDFAF